MALEGPAKVWCDQCDSNVVLSVAAACSRPFCTVSTRQAVAA
jgi:hypothetical protein